MEQNLEQLISNLIERGFYKNSDRSLKCGSVIYDENKLLKYVKKEFGLSEMGSFRSTTEIFNNLISFPESNQSDKFNASALGDWLKMYLEDKHISFRYDETVRQGERTVNLKKFLAQLIIDAEEVGFKGKEALINHHMTILTEDAHDEVRQALRERLEYTEVLRERGEVELRKFVLALRGGNEDRLELDIKVLQHFIWQVKRKLNNRVVYEHMMPVLVGPTGAGKSYNLQKFLQPIKEAAYDAPSMSMLNDERESFIMQKYYVINFDELAGADKTDVNRLKQYITATQAPYRILGMNKVAYGDQVSTFIATSNTTVKRAIYDPTSARRYWQINCGNRKQTERYWDTINSIDFEMIWRSIDEDSLAYPIKADLKEIQFIQATELKAESLLEQFLIDNGITAFPENGTEQSFITINDLFDQFKEFCDDMKRTCPTKAHHG